MSFRNFRGISIKPDIIFTPVNVPTKGCIFLSGLQFPASLYITVYHNKVII